MLNRILEALRTDGKDAIAEIVEGDHRLQVVSFGEVVAIGKVGVEDPRCRPFEACVAILLIPHPREEEMRVDIRATETDLEGMAREREEFLF